MTRFIQLHETPSNDGDAPRPILVNVAHITSAKPAASPAADYKTILTLGVDESIVTLADEFEHVARLIAGDASPFGQFATPGLDLPAVAELLRLVLVSVEALANGGEPSIPPLTMLDTMRERVNQALALIGAENTSGPSAKGEPPVMDAEGLGLLRHGDTVRVYDRELRTSHRGTIKGRGDAPAGFSIRIAGAPIVEQFEPFDNTGRSVTQQGVPHPSIVGGSRFYIVDDFAPDSLTYERQLIRDALAP